MHPPLQVISPSGIRMKPISGPLQHQALPSTRPPSPSPSFFFQLPHFLSLTSSHTLLIFLLPSFSLPSPVPFHSSFFFMASHSSSCYLAYSSQSSYFFYFIFPFTGSSPHHIYLFSLWFLWYFIMRGFSSYILIIVTAIFFFSLVILSSVYCLVSFLHSFITLIFSSLFLSFLPSLSFPSNISISLPFPFLSFPSLLPFITLPPLSLPGLARGQACDLRVVLSIASHSSSERAATREQSPPRPLTFPSRRASHATRLLFHESSTLQGYVRVRIVYIRLYEQQFGLNQVDFVKPDKKERLGQSPFGQVCVK